MPDNGQVERMNRTIKEATVKRFHYETHEQLRTHLTDFATAYNFARRLKTPQRPHTLRSHLQSMDQRAKSIQTRSDPSNAGTKHLACGPWLTLEPEGGKRRSDDRNGLPLPGS